MSALSQSDISGEATGLTLVDVSRSWGSQVARMAEDFKAELIEFLTQPLRSYNETWLGSYSGSLDYERRLATGMFPADINKDEFIPLTAQRVNHIED